jgi:predicted nucleotidyltransferase
VPDSQAAVLFGSRTFPRLLAELAAAPDRAFTASELEARVGASHDSLHRALRRGVGAGLVSRQPVGKQYLYRAETASPIFAEIKTILSRLFGPAEALRRAFATIGPPEVEAAFLFGSAASAQDTLESDLDVFVVGDISRFALARQLGAAEEELGREVNAMAYPRADVERRLAGGDGFVLEVWRKPKLMLVGSEAELPRLPAE